MLNLPNRDYDQYVIRRYLETSTHKVTQLPLPMIDLSLSKQFALPPFLWGLLWEGWEPDVADGNPLFLTAYEDRDAAPLAERASHHANTKTENLLKRRYQSAVTPDLYAEYYQPKVKKFFSHLLGPYERGLPMMRQYLDSYYDLYWDLHLGLSGPEVPPFAREIGTSFMVCLADLDVFDPTFKRNYMTVRELRPQLNRWIQARLEMLSRGVPGAKETIAYYWIKNGIEEKNVVFECFHNFLALSQWGHTIYGVIDFLREGGSAQVRAAYEATMKDPNRDRRTSAEPFSPLDRLVMELFRTIVPNTGSISAETNLQRLGESTAYTVHDHVALAFDPSHWHAPKAFDPERYKTKATSAEPNEERAKRLDFAECPFKRGTYEVEDGRSGVELTNSGYGTVYPVVDGRECPVVDDAGYSPFGFGYRRCPGELMTVAVMEDFLTELWTAERLGARLVKLQLSQTETVPVGPLAMVADNIGLVGP